MLLFLRDYYNEYSYNRTIPYAVAIYLGKAFIGFTLWYLAQNRNQITYVHAIVYSIYMMAWLIKEQYGLNNSQWKRTHLTIYETGVLICIFQVYTLPAFVAYFTERVPGSLIVEQWCGVGIAIIGVLINLIADIYKSNASKLGQVATNGLWRYSRNPNYIGELVFNGGLAMITFNSNDIHALYSAVCIIPLIFVMHLIWFPRMNKKDKKLICCPSRKEQYMKYIELTPQFLPMPYNHLADLIGGIFKTFFGIFATKILVDSHIDILPLVIPASVEIHGERLCSFVLSYFTIELLMYLHHPKQKAVYILHHVIAIICMEAAVNKIEGAMLCTLIALQFEYTAPFYTLTFTLPKLGFFANKDLQIIPSTIFMVSFGLIRVLWGTHAIMELSQHPINNFVLVCALVGQTMQYVWMYYLVAGWYKKFYQTA